MGKNSGQIAGVRMIITPQGRGPHWPPDYRAYAVELQRQYDARKISKAEVELLLQERYPQQPVPEERTRREWAHEKYRDLPEQRRQFFNPQELGYALNSQPAGYALQGIQGQSLSPVLPGEVITHPLARELVNWMVYFTVLSMLAATARMVISSL